MSKHTPGPWTVGIPNNTDNAYLGIRGGDEENYILADLCSDGYPRDVQEANARLIAAAPDLLECLVEARERMLGSAPTISVLRAKTDAAIAKAIGPQDEIVTEPSPAEAEAMGVRP